MSENLTDAQVTSEIVRNYGIVLGGLLAVLLGGWRLYVADKQRRNDERRREIDEQRLINERFAKAVELLGSGRIEGQLGAIYALERLAHDSRRDHWPIMEALAAYVRGRRPRILEDGESIVLRSIGNGRVRYTSRREPAPPRIDPALAKEESIPQRPPEDIRAALAVICKRNIEYDPPGARLDLSMTDLRCADLEGIYLKNAILTAADFRYANLAEANLEGANLEGTRFELAILTAATLSRAKCSFASFHKVHLEEAVLDELDAFHASFYDANMQKLKRSEKAQFMDCDMWRLMGGLANLSGAHFVHCNLSAADLHASKGLTEDQFSRCIFDKNTKLPDALKHLIPKA